MAISRGNDRTTYFPVLFSDLRFKAILTCQGRITNAMVLADRNVITVARREEGEAVCLGNCQNECWRGGDEACSSEGKE